MNNKTVHVIFKTHLDIGFTDFASKVVENYFNNYIPAALKLSRKTRLNGSGENRFIWSTGSWLIEEFLERGDRVMREKMENAIEFGDIAWHALPFTTHTELMDSSLFRSGLAISQRLDRIFGKKTIAAKMTDVPGHCRSIIPMLAEAGVEFLHIGVNPASSTLDLPPLFNWKSPDGKFITVNYVSGYGRPLEVEGLNDFLEFAHSGDNCGPPSEQDLGSEFDKLRQSYPDARIKGSTLTNFAEALRSVSPSLPEVSGEMGDTWIHGVGSDPLKVAEFRQLCRLRKHWEETGRSPKEPGFEAFSKKLLMIPEHTWGMDEKTHLKDYRNYSKEDFLNARNRGEVPQKVIEEGNARFSAFKMNKDDLSSERKNNDPPSYKRFEASWAEQRKYIDESLTCLLNNSFAEEAHSALSELSPVPLSSENLIAHGFSNFDSGQGYISDQFTINFSDKNGAITSLTENETGKSWCINGNQIGLFQYETFSSDSYDKFYEKYNINREWTGRWSVPDFTKPGLENMKSLHHRFYEPENPRFFIRKQKRDDKATEISVLLNMPDEPVSQLGAPKIIQISYSFSDKAIIDIELRWSLKSANRIPEAMWFSFFPDIPPKGQWSIDKMGSAVSPFEVLERGNRALHCTDKGISCRDGSDFLRLEALDTPLISPGRPRILEFDQDQPNMREGVHFNLYNNLWGTNFPMWYEDDGLARFRLHFTELRMK